MRVITGIARGKRLKAPQGGEIVRPTADRVKEAIFSILHFELEGAKILDLFSGSGQLGIEALSRGARYAHFTDVDPVSVKLTEENLANCGFSGQATVRRADYKAFLNGTTEQFDIAFLDPPYSAGILQDALNMTARHTVGGGAVVCEYPRGNELSTPDGFTQKVYNYGKISVSVFRKDTAVGE